MEGDSIRPSGSDTLVGMWINGKVRTICVSRDAIDAFVGLDRAAGMSEDDRCEFVRKNLSLIVTAATASLLDSDPAADSLTIGAGGLPRADGTREGDRRKTERRKTDRRKVKRPTEELSHGERRRGDRRKTDRRRTPTKTS